MSSSLVRPFYYVLYSFRTLTPRARSPVIGTLLTGVACLLFAVINPALPYWAFGFPAAILCVFGADFVFATGTLFTAKVCLPHEQSLGGALFQTLTQIGTSFGLAVSTVVFDARVQQEGGPGPTVKGSHLQAYKDAMWSGLAFGACGALLALIFLRGVGPVGHRKEKVEEGHMECPDVPTSNEHEKKLSVDH